MFTIVKHQYVNSTQKNDEKSQELKPFVVKTYEIISFLKQFLQVSRKMRNT